jgi:putative Flp pilus-assembly TadE/G-like protein
MHTTECRHAAGASDRGSISAFVTSVATSVILLAGLVFDGGMALAAHVKAHGQAEAAARAGAQEIDLAAYRSDGTLTLNEPEATSAARQYLAGIGVDGDVTATAAAVVVTVTTTYETQLLGMIGINTVDVAATASAQPQNGP